MTVITISRGSYSMGKKVANLVAKRLNYECVSREILLEASDDYNIPEIKVLNAIKNPPSIMERINHKKERYINYIQSALVKHIANDNVVYHGLAGNLLLKNISHILKVRIIADPDYRASILMERENLSQNEAYLWISKIDAERHKWTKYLYGVEPWDPTLYDLVINIHSFDVDDAVNIICQSALSDRFKTTDESKRNIHDLFLACQVKIDLVGNFPDVTVVCDYGNVLIYTKKGEQQANKIKNLAEKICAKIEDINNVEIHNGVSPPDNAV